jgi:hypothetical protein
MFYATHPEVPISDNTTQVHRFLFELGRQLVKHGGVRLGVIVSSDHGASELASLSAGVLLETLSAKFSSVAAPMSLYEWLQRQPDGVRLVDKRDNRTWEKVARTKADAPGAIRFRPTRPMRGDPSRIITGDPVGDHWGLDQVALGVRADTPWPLCGLLPADEVSKLDVEGALSSTLAIYIVASESMQRQLDSCLVRLVHRPECSFPLPDWLAVQSESNPRAFYRTTFVSDNTKLQEALSKQRLAHSATQLVVICAGPLSGAVARRLHVNGYSRGNRRVSLCSILPARLVGPEQLAGLREEWSVSAQQAEGGESQASDLFKCVKCDIKELMGACPRGIGVVQA